MSPRLGELELGGQGGLPVSVLEREVLVGVPATKANLGILCVIAAL